MATYTRIGPDDIKDIVSKYDLGPIVHFENLDGGQANSSYKLETTAGRFVVSICDEKSFDQVKQLTGVLKHLEDQGFFTTRVVSATNGRLVVEHREKPVLIKRYLEGSVPRKMTPERLRALGREIARLHGVKPPKGLLDRFPYDLEAFDEVILSSADTRYRKWLKEKKAFLAQTLRQDLPKGLIHGDIFYDNTLFKGDALVAIIDFEEACQYAMVFDIGMCITGACSTHGLVDLSKARHLVKGYERVRALENAEKKQLQAFVIYGAVATSFWRFRQYNIIMPNHSDAKTHEKMDRIADQVHQMPKSVFYDGVFNR